MDKDLHILSNFDTSLTFDPETWFKVVAQLLPKATGT